MSCEQEFLLKNDNKLQKNRSTKACFCRTGFGQYILKIKKLAYSFWNM